MAQSFYLLNTYSNVPLAVDPTLPDFGLRASSSSDAPLLFTFTSIPSTNLFKICTSSLATPYCLDVYGDKKYTPHLTQLGDYLGQQWSVLMMGTTFKLSNEYTGPGWFLDVYADTKAAHMTQGDYQGQYWARSDAGSGARSSMSNVPSSTAARLDDAAQLSTLPKLTDQATSTQVVTATNSAGHANDNSTSNSLSGGAIAGIVIGVVAAIAIAGIATFLLWRRRQKKRNRPAQAMTPANPNYAKLAPEHSGHSGHIPWEMKPETNQASELPGNQQCYPPQELATNP